MQDEKNQIAIGNNLSTKIVLFSYLFIYDYIMKLYLHERPRSFVVCGNGYALIIRHPYPIYKSDNRHGKNDGTNSTSCNKIIVEFVNQDLLNFSNFKDITPNKQNKKLLGFIGLLNMKGNVYLGFITESSLIASPTLDDKIYRIKQVDFYCLNNDEFDHFMNKDVDDEQVYSGHHQHERDRSEYPASSVRKLLSLGSFFYSTDFDITSSLQERGFTGIRESGFMLQATNSYCNRFMWNSYMNSELIEFRSRLSGHECALFDKAGFLITITRGYAQTVNSVLNGDENALLTLISKQSCKKTGPLFGDWGCDDNGSVSNFAETEVIIYSDRFCFSYVIIRGNVPTIWHLETYLKKNILSKKNKRVVFPRSFEASQHALARHFDQLTNHFGEVHIINSLSDDPKTYKGELSQNYKEHIKYFNHCRDEVTDSTVSPQSKLLFTDITIPKASMKKIGYSATNPSSIVHNLVDSILDYGALFYDNSKGLYVGKQQGVFRINSFDSLNKANLISKIVSQEVITLAFRDIGITVDSDLLVKHARLWAENEDYLAKLSLGFASSSDKLLGSSATSTKGSVKSHITKKYLSGVVEGKPNEIAMLKLLGRLQDQDQLSFHNPLHDYVQGEMNKRIKEFSSSKDISVYASTFNVNGSCYKGDITEWIFPSKYGVKKSYDIVLIGFEEIVELTPGKMVNTKSENTLFWESKIKKTLDNHNPDKTKYLSLWNGQLGGIALLLFVKEPEAANIMNVEGAFKKTGFGGMSANKGGVAVSFTYYNTELCLVASHFAAGASNVIERHQNYKTLSRMKFTKNRRIKDHDAVIWIGDLNYRIDLAIEDVKMLIEKRNLVKLFEYDQLNKEMASGGSFPFFDEMEIKFPPTYKFDNGTKTYDTSEKQRIPAWTDRILSLSKNKIVKPLFYDCDEDIIFSDHRPVYATFNISLNIINESIKKSLSSELNENYRNQIGDINDALINSKNIAYLISDYGDNELPPPSSDINKWWLDSTKPVKINIPELNSSEDLVINPNLPINPFEETSEPEFVHRSEISS